MTSALLIESTAHAVKLNVNSKEGVFQCTAAAMVMVQCIAIGGNNQLLTW